MTLTVYKKKLENLADQVLTDKIAMATYNEDLINLINQFYDEALKTPKEDLIKDMLDFVSEVRRAQS